MMKNYTTNACRIPDDELLEFGLHGGSTANECQRCTSSVCEAHTVVIQDLYDRQVLCAHCSKLAVSV